MFRFLLRFLSRGCLPAIALAMALTGPAAAADNACADGTVPATIETDHGPIDIALDRANTPKTVANFMAYARDGFFAGTVFHRVIPDFMIQGGGLNADLERKDTRAPVVNESDNGLSNARGTLAMARTRDPDSATSQFFINLGDNPRLDAQGDQPGYTVFARVTDGMDVVDRIAAVPTTSRAGRRNVPREAVTIESVTLHAGDCDDSAAGARDGAGDA